MDAERFDRLSRALSTTPTRRVLFTALAALVAVPGTADVAAADCREIFQRCRRTSQCCGHRNGRVICARNPQTGIPDKKSCCVAEGERCAFGGQCCGGLNCTPTADGPVCAVI
jgi:hypothetical protein